MMKGLLNALDQLSISGKATSTEADRKFTNELEETELDIFTPLSDYGYFAWNPQRPTDDGTKYKMLKTLESPNDVLQHIDIDGKPAILGNIKNLKLPKMFEGCPDRTFENKYPYGQNEISSIVVATKYRGLNLDDADFIFGGSTLEMLATRDDSNPFAAAFIPQTKCIAVAKRKEYEANLSDNGFQFERFVTGKGMANTSEDIQFIEHVHLAKVGNYKVLFCAEVDATLDGSPVEVKCSNPRYWGTKVMFQMISSGSTKLCHGEKFRGTLTRVNLKKLSAVSRDALAYSNVADLQKNIIDGMTAIQSQMKENKVCKISFSGYSRLLKLIPAEDEKFAVFPPSKIVNALLK